MKNLLYSLSVFVLITSCDPCPDCGEPLLSEPTVEMIFINQDSVISIDNTLLVYDSLDSSFTSINFVLDVFRDSLDRIEDSLALGLLEYLDERDDLLDSIMKLQIDSSYLDELKIDSNTIVLTNTKSDINSGLMKIESLRVLESGAEITYQDSATAWNFPLIYDGEVTSYDLTISGELFSIALGYETFTEVNQEREVVIRANDIEVIESSANFNTLDSCNTNCVDGNASFIFYF